ncbi:MAG: hypothetical protein B5766_06770 [Candidatus Lumbricidophila eiseniae]|uniref:DNA-binding transcriptional regulator n=1 Tax=Candidatus Lumbricidiphila eiseniae TaxID=1969409 RepID=A0A2A6FRR0_9MICO|nr:MAG: hypothetical protein B5766_06770 [Candidatus Lumbricidophila eiseniae]
MTTASGSGEGRPPELGAPLTNASDRLVFLLSLVPYLLDQQEVSVRDAAHHFRVSDEDIRRAVRLIASSGLPGDTGTYQPNDLFDIAWDAFENDDLIVLVTHPVLDDTPPRLSAGEAAALIAGLQYLSVSLEGSGSTALASLTQKLAASATPARLAVAAEETNALLTLIREAVTAGRQLEFDYRNARGQSGPRRVDPLQIRSQDSDWYLQAYCYQRAAVRNFRLDRMSALRMSDHPLVTHPDQELPESLFQSSDTDLQVVVSVVPSALPLLSDYLTDAEQINVADRVHVTLRVSHLHVLTHLVASRPGLVTVVAPPEARRVVVDWARAALERYE